MTYFDPQRSNERNRFSTRMIPGDMAPGGSFAPAPYSASPLVQRRRGSRIGSGLFYSISFVVVIWAVFLINLVGFGDGLNQFGIHPLDTSGLWGIVAAPFLHANFEHIISNTVPGAVFAFLIGLSGRRVFWEVTLIVILAAGVGTWFIGGIGTNHIGASGLVYGWLAYLLVRGVFNRSLWQIFIGVLLGFVYSGFVWGVLPGTPGISWQAHLCGALGGLGAGMIITSDDPPHLVAKRHARRARHTR